MSNKLKTAIEAAKVGAKEVLKYFDTTIETEDKEDKTPVTVADRKSEEAIKTYISSKFSKAKFVAEESGGDRNQDEFWIIDPLDGTRSFSRGIPTWCVLIALYRNKEIVLGVCYFPLLGVLLYAELGKGAFYNGKKIHVSNIKHLNKSYIAYGSFRHFKEKRKQLIKLIDTVGGARSPEATYAHYLVACGKFDVSIDAYAHVWDAAPFKVIIEEAGGKLTNLKGEEWTVNGRGIICSNRFLHDEVVRIVNGKQLML